MFVYCILDVYEVDENFEVFEKENEISFVFGRSGEFIGELLVVDSLNE